VLVLDVDNFKRINDQVGHLAGDTVLAEVADRIRTVIRASDIAGRVGGDEFAVILPESSRAEGERLAARIMQAVATAAIQGAGTLQISAGVAELQRDDGPTSLFERADQALYRAKTLGKGRAVAG
jgi:diguanylate cyclase (GGDEF)-like protein